MKIGKPDVNNKKYAKKKYFSILKGTQVYRILPPMGELAERGIWNTYAAVHFGYRGTNGYLRVFQSPKVVNRKTKMVEVPDEAEEHINRLRATKAQLEERQKTSNSPAIEAQIAKIDGELQKFNLEKRFYVNAMNLNGEIGLLKLKMREKNAIDAARKQIEEAEGIDPIGVEGAFLTIVKSGDGAQNSVVSVTLNMKSETVGGKTFKVPNTHTVTEDLYPRLEKEAFELNKLFVKPTAEEVAEMVKGGPAAVDVVFEKYRTSYQKDTSTTVSSPAKTASSTVSDESEPDFSLSDDPPMMDDEEIDAAPAQTKQAAAPSAPAASTATEMSDEDFLKSLNIDL